MHQPLDASSDAFSSRLRRTANGAQPSAIPLPATGSPGLDAGLQLPAVSVQGVAGAPSSPRLPHRSSHATAAALGSRPLSGGSLGASALSSMLPATGSPVLGKQTLDTYDVVQLLEKELASERFERREEVSFITKMHEREIDVWKTRAQGATQRLEEERKIFERETGSLDSKLAVAIERARWHEDKARKLEQDVSKHEADIEGMRAVGHRAETAVEAAARAKDAEHEAERRLAHEEREKLETLCKQVEHDAQLTAKDLRHGELTAQRHSSALEQTLRSTESRLLAMKQQEAQMAAQMQSQEAFEARTVQARDRADAEVAAQVSQLRVLQDRQEEACRTIEKLEMQVEAGNHRTGEALHAEKRALEASDTMHAAELRMRSNEHEAELRMVLEKARCDALSDHDQMRSKQELLEKELAEAKLSADIRKSESERAALDLEQQFKEVQQLQHALRQLEEWRDGRVEADIQRELEHGRSIQKEHEAVTVHRLEASFLEKALRDERSRAAKEEQESEHRETQHTTLEEDLRRSAAKADVDLARCQAALNASEQNQARSHASFELTQAELMSIKVQMKQDEVEWNDRVQEVRAALTQATSESKAQAELLVERVNREQTLTMEVEQQWSQIEQQRVEMEAMRHRMREELDEVAEQRLTLARANDNLQEDYEHLQDQNHQLLRTSQCQEHRIAALDSTLRSHLEILDNEVADLCSLKRVIATTESLAGPASPTTMISLLQ